jgi:crossover junction endodeoxyribonuclease RuvC
MIYILGIDPGRNGALAVMSVGLVDGVRRVTTHDMPDTDAGLQTLLAELPKVAFAVVEKPFYPHHIGVRAIATIAETFGALRAGLQFFGIPQHPVTPSDWKAALSLSPDKAASRRRAAEFFPDDADQWTRVKHDGRAEAALIAWYGLRWAK